MNWDKAVRIAQEIMACKTSDTDFIDLRDDFITVAVRYSGLRVKWYIADSEKRREMDQERSAAHDALVSTYNAFVRYMGKINPDMAQRENLPQDRKSIGDFACYLCAWIGILAR
ncbi:MAG: hypothetical protein JXA92_12730 [candidate division Zixibacteria bacterium]|nr:hypothetical protein [candidate division Zixibacteria bacterium]